MNSIVVIPAYNEQSIIGSVIGQVKKQIASIIVVDDGSTDQTAIVARRAGATVFRHRLNRGQGAALQTGIIAALERGADIIVTFDADGQFRAEEIDRVVAPLLLNRVDVVLGSRFLQANTIPTFRRWVIKLATWTTRFYTGLAITDTHNGFRAFSRRAAEQITISQRGMAHASEIIEEIKKYQLKFMEVPVTIRYTDYSLKKGQPLSHSVKIVWDLIFSRLVK
jgi:polyprenyl-phospho-N-acetylgalactosaminyl synthase